MSYLAKDRSFKCFCVITQMFGHVDVEFFPGYHMRKFRHLVRDFLYDGFPVPLSLYTKGKNTVAYFLPLY